MTLKIIRESRLNMSPALARFNMGQLPLWAKKQMTEPQGSGNGAGDRGGVDMPKGRWAQRLHNNAITFKSHYDTDSVIPFPARGESWKNQCQLQINSINLSKNLPIHDIIEIKKYQQLV